MAEKHVQFYRLVPWTWSAAWLLTALGAGIANIFSSPSGGLISYIGLSAVGWGAAGYVTARASGGKAGLPLRLAAWAGAYLVAVPLGLAWIFSRDMPPFLLFVPFLLAGALGGAASSLRGGAWRWVSAAFVGVVFFLFYTIGLYAGYVLVLLYGSLPQRVIDLGSSYSVIWALPGAVFGLAAGFAARAILGIKPVDPAD
jgi:hypothetical protein